MFTFFKKRRSQKHFNNLLFSDLACLKSGVRNISFQQAYEYFYSESTLYAIVTDIAKQASQINFEDEKLNKHFNNKLEFNFFVSYLLTGNAFFMASGLKNKQIEGVAFVNPCFITETEKGLLYKGVEYHWDESLQAFENAGVFIYHFKIAEPILQNTRFALSPLNSAVDALDVLIRGDKYNSSLLKNGAMPSLLLNYDLSEVVNVEEQKQQISNQVRSKMEGVENAGRAIISFGSKIDVKPISQSNKDMDFKDLQIQVMYKLVRIYLYSFEKIDNSNSTYNNVQTSNIQLFENCIKTLVNDFRDFLENIHLRRNIRLNVDIDNSSLPDVLLLAKLQAMVQAKKTGVLTTDEIREIGGYAPILGNDE